MSPERRRAIASKGGKSVAPWDRVFFRNRTFAAACGKKGGVHKRKQRA